MSRTPNADSLTEAAVLSGIGLRGADISGAITHVYELLDAIDSQLLSAGGDRLASLVELANLSAIVGNLFRGGIVRHSEGRFEANAPHKYPDLLGRLGAEDLEIKVALEANQPKGHLIKPGPHLVLRYVLGSADKTYVRGKENRGNVVWIWEVRVGRLEETHFSVSNTPGDSGKTAVINSAGMSVLDLVYFDEALSPRSRRSKT